MADDREIRDLPSFIARVENVFERFDTRFANIERTQAEQGAIISHLAESQEGIFSRINRPFPWVILGIIVSVIGIGIGLLMQPVLSEQERQHHFDTVVMQEIKEQARINGYTEADLEWLKRLEDRQNARIHDAFNGN